MHAGSGFIRSHSFGSYMALGHLGFIEFFMKNEVRAGRRKTLGARADFDLAQLCDVDCLAPLSAPSRINHLGVLPQTFAPFRRKALN